MEFEEYLRTLPIRESSIRKYETIFNNIPKDIFDSVDKINLFLAERSRNFNDSRLYFAVIKHYLQFNKKFDFIQQLHYPKNHRQVRTPNYYEIPILFKILDNLKTESYKVAGYIQFYGGLRAIEVMSVKFKDIKLFDDYVLIFIRKAKREPYEVKIVGTGFKKLVQYLDKHSFTPNELIFCKPTKSVDEPTKIKTNVSYYQREIKETAQSLGYELTPHDLKRNLARYLQSQGIAIEEIKEALHHKNIETTLIYIGKISSQRVYSVLKERL